jgi:hypothetical protein
MGGGQVDFHEQETYKHLTFAIEAPFQRHLGPRIQQFGGARPLATLRAVVGVPNH